MFSSITTKFGVEKPKKLENIVTARGAANQKQSVLEGQVCDCMTVFVVDRWCGVIDCQRQLIRLI